MSLLRTLLSLCPCPVPSQGFYLAQSFRSLTESISPLRSLTTALIRCPHTTSGGPITATSGENRNCTQEPEQLLGHSGAQEGFKRGEGNSTGCQHWKTPWVPC